MEQISTILETIGFGEKIGRLLQILAKVIFCLSVVGAIGACVIMIMVDDDLIGLALGILFGAPISAYIGGLPLYAIGLIAERSVTPTTPSTPHTVPALSDTARTNTTPQENTANHIDDLPQL